MKARFSFLAVLLLLAIFSVGVYAQDDVTIAGAIEASADDESEFTILFQLLDETGLLETLDDAEAEFTIFAPTDEAFEGLLEELEIDINELLEDADAVTNILLYHVVEGSFLSEDLDDDMELQTLNGASIVVTVNSSGDILLDEFAEVVEPDLEQSNGVIHTIDGVLLPPDDASSGGGEACLIFTEEVEGVQVRVGPGENRGVVAFLPVDVEFEVLGQATDNDGNIWFKLDKEQATPNRSNAEAWVAADAVETIGNCDNVVDVNAPPVIPITQAQPTAAPSNSGDSGGDTSSGDTGTTTTDTSGQIIVQTGTWRETLSPNIDASCQGTGNVSIPTTEIYTSTSYTYNLSHSGTGFNLGGTIFTYIGDNTYQGVESVGPYTGTWYLRATSETRMEARFIFSFSSGGTNCSATVYSTFTR
jgi:uncharacterized surface protein with fasciclin (FAS1) repeats